MKTIGLGADVSDLAVGFGSVWVAGGNAGTLTRINPHVNLVEKTFTFGKVNSVVVQPIFLVATGAGAVWISRGDRVLKIDPATNQVLQSTQVRGVPFGLDAGGGGVWVTTYDERLVRIDPSTVVPTATHQLPNWGHFPLISRGRLWLLLYAGEQPPGQVWQLDPNTLEQTTARLLPSGHPWQLDAGEGALWTTDWKNGSIWRIDPVSVRLTPVATIGRNFPTSITAGYGLVWVGVAVPIR